MSPTIRPAPAESSVPELNVPSKNPDVWPAGGGVITPAGFFPPELNVTTESAKRHSASDAPVAAQDALTIPFDLLLLEDGIKYEDRLISRQALSRWLGVTPNRLRLWASQGYGPPALRPGFAKTAYRIGDVLTFLQSRSAVDCPDVRKAQKQTAGDLSLGV